MLLQHIHHVGVSVQAFCHGNGIQRPHEVSRRETTQFGLIHSAREVVVTHGSVRSKGMLAPRPGVGRCSGERAEGEHSGRQCSEVASAGGDDRRCSRCSRQNVVEITESQSLQMVAVTMGGAGGVGGGAFRRR